MAAAGRQRPLGAGADGGAAIDESLVCGLNLPIYVVVYETDKYIYVRLWQSCVTDIAPSCRLYDEPKLAKQRSQQLRINVSASHTIQPEKAPRQMSDLRCG